MVEQSQQHSDLAQSEKEGESPRTPFILKLKKLDSENKGSILQNQSVSQFEPKKSLIYASGIPKEGLKLNDQDKIQLSISSEVQPHYLNETEVSNLGFMEHYKFVEKYQKQRENGLVSANITNNTSQQCVDLSGSMPSEEFKYKRRSSKRRTRQTYIKISNMIQTMKKDTFIEQEESLPTIKLMGSENNVNDFNFFMNSQQNNSKDQGNALLQQRHHYLIMQRKIQQQVFFSKEVMSEKSNSEQQDDEEKDEEDENDNPPDMKEKTVLYTNQNTNLNYSYLVQVTKQFNTPSKNSQDDENSVKKLKTTLARKDSESNKSSNVIVQHKQRERFLQLNLIIKSKNYSMNMKLMLTSIFFQVFFIALVLVLFLSAFPLQLNKSKNILTILNLKSVTIYGITQVLNVFEQEVYLQNKLISEGLLSVPGSTNEEKAGGGGGGDQTSSFSLDTLNFNFLSQQLNHVYQDFVNQTEEITGKSEFHNFYEKAYSKFYFVDREKQTLVPQYLSQDASYHHIVYNLYFIQKSDFLSENASTLISSTQIYREYVAANYLIYYQSVDNLENKILEYSQDNLYYQFSLISFMAAGLLVIYIIFAVLHCIYWSKFSEEILGCYNLWEATDKVWINKFIEKGLYLSNIIDQNIDLLQCYKFNYHNIQKNMEWQEAQKESLYKEFRKSGRSHLIHLPKPKSPILWYLKFSTIISKLAFAAIIAVFIIVLLYNIDYHKRAQLYSYYGSISSRVSELLFLKNQIYNINTLNITLIDNSNKEKLTDEFDSKLADLQQFYQHYIISYDRINELYSNFKSLLKQLNSAKLCTLVVQYFDQADQTQCSNLIDGALQSGLVNVLSYYINELKTERETDFSSTNNYSLSLDEGKVEGLLYLNQVNENIINYYNTYVANKVDQLNKLNIIISSIMLVLLILIMAISQQLIIKNLSTQNRIARQSLFLVPPYSLYNDTRFITKFQMYLTEKKFHRM